MKKIALLTVLAGVILFSGTTAGSAQALCNTSSGTNVNTSSTNIFFGSQTSFMGSFSGGNGLLGNIGQATLVVGGNTQTSTQTMSRINRNVIGVNVTQGGTSSSTTVVNTGSGVLICN